MICCNSKPFELKHEIWCLNTSFDRDNVGWSGVEGLCGGSGAYNDKKSTRIILSQ